MTPQERDLVTQLFDRLATFENAPRDPEAEHAIIDGLRRAPNAAYALVQTVLVQDETLKRADARLRELEGEPAGNERPTGFLDGVREALLGRRETSRFGSVPSVRQGQPANGTAPVMGGPPGPQAPMTTGGPSFLGTAAAAAAGMIGGSLLLDGIRSMSGHGHGASALADPAFGGGKAANSPWGGSDDLARDAGIDHIGNKDQQAGLFDANADDPGADQQDDDDFGGYDADGSDFGNDFGGGNSGGSDVA